jgi:hypothetical protein
VHGEKISCLVRLFVAILYLFTCFLIKYLFVPFSLLDKLYLYNICLFDISVTDHEIMKGIVEASNPGKHTTFFTRTLTGLSGDALTQKMADRYIDIVDKDGKVFFIFCFSFFPCFVRFYEIGRYIMDPLQYLSFCAHIFF